jgi:DNA-binding SARP family transcriptional activator
MITIRICLFGKFSAKVDGMPVTGLESSKVQELFSYLLCHRDRAHSRERLADTIWNRSQATQSRKYLRQALWLLQTVLNSLYPSGPTPFLDIDADWIRLRSHESLWLDVAEFERGYSCCQNKPSREMNEAQSRLLYEAADIYCGELLEGCYQDWCLYERERLNSAYLTILYKLMNYCESRLDCETGINLGRRILQCDRASERTHLQMMRLYAIAGDRTAALRQYQLCRHTLAEELGVQPSRETVALYEQIRADTIKAVDDSYTIPALTSETTRVGSSVGMAEMLKILGNLQEMAKNMQWQVEQGIKSVKDTLRGQKTTDRD